MAIVDKIKPVQDVLNGIKRSKKMCAIVEETLLLAKILNIDVCAIIHGYGLDSYKKEQLSEVMYELKFSLNNFQQRVSFFYRNNKINRVEFIFNKTFYREYNNKGIVSMLNNFKEHLVKGVK